MRRFALIFLLLMLGLPALEIYTMFVVSDYIGWWLLAWLFLSALLGWVLIKEESMAVFGRLALAVQSDQSPFAALWDSGRTMLAAFLLIFPGIWSDFFALILLLIPNKTEKHYAQPRPDSEFGTGEIIEGEIVEVRETHEYRSLK